MLIFKRVLFCSVFLLCFLKVGFVFAVNLISNPSFEEGLTSWQKYGGELALSTAPIYSGSASAQLSSTTESTKWIYQIIPVTSGTPYLSSVYAFKNDSNVKSVYLRIAWYGSADGSGAQISYTDSIASLTENRSEFQFLSTGAVLSPDGANSASIKGMVALASTSEAKALFDNFSFEQTIMPTPTSTITPSLTPLPTNTPLPTSTSLPTPTSTSRPPSSTPTPTPTLKLTATLLPSPTLVLTLEPTEISFSTPTENEQMVLGEETSLEPNIKQEIKQLASLPENEKNYIFPAIAIFAGVFLVGFSFYSFLRGRK